MILRWRLHTRIEAGDSLRISLEVRPRVVRPSWLLGGRAGWKLEASVTEFRRSADGRDASFQVALGMLLLGEVSLHMEGVSAGGFVCVRNAIQRSEQWKADPRTPPPAK